MIYNTDRPWHDTWNHVYERRSCDIELLSIGLTRVAQ